MTDQIVKTELMALEQERRREAVREAASKAAMDRLLQRAADSVPMKACTAGGYSG